MAKKKNEPVSQEEMYQPMAIPDPTPLERLEAAEIQIKLMKDALNYLYQQHYRKDAV